MTVEIRGEQRPISLIFNDEFAFSVPPYQRPYLWETEHAGALLDKNRHTEHGAIGKLSHSPGGSKGTLCALHGNRWRGGPIVIALPQALTEAETLFFQDVPPRSHRSLVRECDTSV